MSGIGNIFITPNFRKFWFARTFSTFAFQMQGVAVGWQMYALTHDAFYLGLVGLAQFLPMFALTLVVGHAADRYDRRRIIVITQVIEGCAVLALAAGSFRGIIGKEALLSIVFVIGAAKAFEGPTLQALLPSLVHEKDLPRAFAWSSTAFQVASIAGPALGGLMYTLHVTVVYGIVGALFICACAMIASIPPERQKRVKEPVSLESVLAGIRYIRQKPVILGSISLDLFAVLFGGATALLPVYATDILHTGPWGLGLLRSASAIGALVMSLYLIRHPLRRGVGEKMFLSVALFGVMTVLFGVLRWFVVSFIALLALGAFDMVSVVVRQSLIQLRTPDAMRGRVSAVNSLFIGTSNQLGEFESGMTAALFGTVPSVVIGGIGTLIVVGIWAKLFPDLRKADRLH